MAGLNLLLGAGFEIEDAEGISRISDDAGIVLRIVLSYDASLQKGSDPAEGRDVGACRQKLEEFSPGSFAVYNQVESPHLFGALVKLECAFAAR
jgi:hypothetical protein